MKSKNRWWMSRLQFYASYWRTRKIIHLWRIYEWVATEIAEIKLIKFFIKIPLRQKFWHLIQFNLIFLFTLKASISFWFAFDIHFRCLLYVKGNLLKKVMEMKIFVSLTWKFMDINLWAILLRLMMLIWRRRWLMRICWIASYRRR